MPKPIGVYKSRSCFTLVFTLSGPHICESCMWQQVHPLYIDSYFKNHDRYAHIKYCVYILHSLDMPGFIHNSSSILSFSVNASHPFDHQCYNISADFSVSNICDYYSIDFVDGILITLQLMSYNITDSVSIDGISTTYVLVDWPIKCIQTFTSSTTTAISNGVIAAIVLVIVTILSVVSAISAIIVYQRMRKFKINK